VVLILVGVTVNWPVEEFGEGKPGTIGPEDELMRWERVVKRGTATKKISKPARTTAARLAIRQVAVGAFDPARIG
jgi:hypothetical protein